ncbi:Holliday junction DNA helicase subunit RuvA [Roseivirga ehrenbergii]|uniref:Holliday junction branch migration complex subunit RuvA n=1 Tax=Roseivirga ehrenbergii (strain DSM 102268 / JCM 13514 / KCTC 12282 / NCIMB 14502 / KMM 6017) TaxID=279360 RepID=A0A150XT78_ROSEK|nr:Holliday junction branch migration protein RuvA [Roseivirga ehrenbergii]KYG81845.1 Holliday junction ATP-dependent DNA helicase RuvA [Roseivirga ehrenbergii]TCL01654.1 Holliday junction DNA helicase subunit RuvA [Roseivirga ehrenbergii]
MFAYVKGKLAYKDPTFVIIDIQGVGYEIKISLNTYSQIKDEEQCKLFTYFHVKEDIQVLYGFADEAEKKLFTLLISISGIGPSIGLMFLSSLSPSEIINAIATENVATIQGVKGVGAKTAQRVILELKDKVGKESADMAGGNITSSSINTIRNEALAALVTLGINKVAAQKSIDKILKNSEGQISLEELIKLALKAA